MSEYYYNENYFEEIDSEKKAYWLGFLCADGHIEEIYRGNKVKAMRACLSLKEEDANHLDKFVSDIGSNVLKTQRISSIGEKSFVSYRVRVNCTKMCRDLIEHGCTPKKSLSLQFPHNSIPSSLMRHFIRGYFDGDGCVSFRVNDKLDKRNMKVYTRFNFLISFVGSLDFLKELQRAIMVDTGINLNFVNTPHCGAASELRMTRYKSANDFYRYLYDDANVFLDRKHDHFQHAISELSSLGLQARVTAFEKSGKNGERLAANTVLNDQIA